MRNLKIIEKTKKVYLVQAPERFNHSKGSEIVLKFFRREYLYFPRARTFFKLVAFTSEELREIAKELDKLNKK